MQMRILGLAIGLAAVGAAAVGPRPASATPAFTQKTGLACAVCHTAGQPPSAQSVTPAGGDFMSCRMNDGCIGRWVATLSPPARPVAPVQPAQGGQNDRWGSIAAVDGDSDAPGTVERWGIGRGKTREAAEAAALSTCRGSGFGGCEIKVSFKNQCGAYASSKKRFGQGVGATIDEASDRALSDCGKSKCQVALKACAWN